MTKYVLYGISDAANSYKVVRYDFVEGENLSVKYLKTHAYMMQSDFPAIDHVYMVDAGPDWSRDYKRTIKQNSIEANVIFKMSLEKYGVMII